MSIELLKPKGRAAVAAISFWPEEFTLYMAKKGLTAP
jgi:hypothetical protein